LIMNHTLRLSRLSVLPLLVATGVLVGCSLGQGDENLADTSASGLGTDVTIPRLPEPGGTGDLTPWGGADSSKWRPEAIVANAASRAMNDGWSRADVKDVVVAIPLKLWSSGFSQFGDGQANAPPEL